MSTRTPNPLETLAEKYQPSKRDLDYLRHYWRHLGDVRHEVRKVCEIGVQTDHSVSMWEEFFPQATIHGIDIDSACRAFEKGRIKIYIGDQANDAFLDQFMNETGCEFDLIIDDGSHDPLHQIHTFERLFPALTTHGTYVLEDMGGCIGDQALLTINRLKALVDNVNYWPVGVPPDRWWWLSSFPEGAGWFNKNVVGIAFYRFIAFIMRGNNPEDNAYLGRWEDPDDNPYRDQ